MSRVDMWRIHQVAKTYGKLPSEVLCLDFDEFHVNESVMALGIRIENIQNAHYDEKKGQHRPSMSELLKKPGSKPLDAAETVHASDWVSAITQQASGKHR